MPSVRCHHSSDRSCYGLPTPVTPSSAPFRVTPPPATHGLGAAPSSVLRDPSAPSPELPTVPELQQRDIGGLGFLSRMRGPGSAKRRGRRGRRTAAMIRAAQERIQDLFSLAETEARRSPNNLSRRYVLLARRIGMRYNVRLLREYRDLYCRGCSTFWVEGRSVRTRLRSGRRTRTCLSCGRVRRVRLKPHAPGPDLSEEALPRGARREQAVLIDEGLEPESELDLDEREEE